MNVKRIENFCLRHDNQEAWLFGKGPSLDDFDQNQAGPLRICINESVCHVNNPTYFFAHDEAPIFNSLKQISNGCLAVLEPNRARYAIECGLSPEQVVTYEKTQQQFPDACPDPGTIAKTNQLVGLSSTAHSAIHFCKLVGASKLNLVGFDGRGGYARCLDVELQGPGHQHLQIRRDSEQLLNSLGFDFEFINDANKQITSPNAKKVDYGWLYDKLRVYGYHSEEENHLAPYLDWIVEYLDIKTVLDVGCSTGSSLDSFAEQGFNAKGVEVSSLAVASARKSGRDVIQGCATSLPYDGNSFDLVCSADVMEHLTEADGIKACAEACRVAKKYVFMKIAEREDVTQKWKEIAGHPLHVNQKPIQWWLEHFTCFGRVKFQEGEAFCIELPQVHS